MKKIFNKIICLFIAVGLNWVGLFGIGQTVAYFNDAEISEGNVYTMGTLDFALTNESFNDTIGLTERISFGTVITNSGSLDFQYTVEAEKISGSDDFCNALKMEAELNGIEKHDAGFMEINTAPDTMLGSWTFYIKMPYVASNIPHGEICEMDFVFKGWQEDVANYSDGGFSDEERVRVNLTSSMIRLNEFLPNPEGFEYGFNFGTDSEIMPQGEWVEIYNNSDFDLDLAGYRLADADGNSIDVEPCRINTGSTIISGKDFLVVYRNAGADCNSHNFSLNNTSDTINLFDDVDSVVDSYSYASSEYCDIEPTPGNENSTDTFGDCPDVPPNKSYARIPDGIGYWVDPIPTPGEVNLLDEKDQVVQQSPALEYITPETQAIPQIEPEPENKIFETPEDETEPEEIEENIKKENEEITPEEEEEEEEENVNEENIEDVEVENEEENEESVFEIINDIVNDVYDIETKQNENSDSEENFEIDEEEEEAQEENEEVEILETETTIVSTSDFVSDETTLDEESSETEENVVEEEVDSENIADDTTENTTEETPTSEEENEPDITEEENILPSEEKEEEEENIIIENEDKALPVEEEIEETINNEETKEETQVATKEPIDEIAETTNEENNNENE